jgi:hypothetical protein
VTTELAALAMVSTTLGLARLCVRLCLYLHVFGYGWLRHRDGVLVGVGVLPGRRIARLFDIDFDID